MLAQNRKDVSSIPAQASKDLFILLGCRETLHSSPGRSAPAARRRWAIQRPPLAGPRPTNAPHPSPRHCVSLPRAGACEAGAPGQKQARTGQQRPESDPTPCLRCAPPVCTARLKLLQLNSTLAHTSAPSVFLHTTCIFIDNAGDRVVTTDLTDCRPPTNRFVCDSLQPRPPHQRIPLQVPVRLEQAIHHLALERQTPSRPQ